jgi:flagellin
MSLVVNHNLMAMTAARNLTGIYNRLGNSVSRLSSGLRVNSAADDAAGLAIRELMRSDIAVLNQGIRNASDAISMIQTAEGAMSVIDEKLIRMKELAEQASTGTYTTAQREIMNSEYQAMAAEIDRIANATDFNGVKILDGSLTQSHSGSGMKIHFGTGNDAAEDYYYVNIGDMRATYETGLRVGNSDPRDTLRTVTLNASNKTDSLDETAGTTDGLFGIRFTEDFNEEAPGSATWNIFGYIDVDASRDSISDLVNEINAGTQATGTLTAAAMSTISTDDNYYGAQSLTVNGYTFTFTTAASASIDTANKTGVIALTSVTSAATVGYDIGAYLNTYASDIGVHAATTGTVVNMIAYEGGADGNTINTVSGTTTLTLGQATLSGGGETPLTASAYYDEANEEWELQVQMNHGGEKYQVQIFSLSSITGTTVNSPSIVGGLISGTSMNGTSGSAAFYGVLPTTAGFLADYGSVDQVDEWTQPQNGSGTTEWAGADILTQSGAQEALAAMDVAINKKDTARANLGAIQNRLENTITNLQIQAENLQAAESRISDVDVATEMTEFTRNNILAQAATAMLAQANSLPQLALQLLG